MRFLRHNMQHMYFFKIKNPFLKSDFIHILQILPFSVERFHVHKLQRCD